MKMNRITVAVLPLLFSAAAAFAQAPQSAIRESTDPARIAEVERRAQELRDRQAAMGNEGQPRMRRQPMAEDHGHGHGHAHGDDKRHHGRKHGHHRMHPDHPKAAPGAGR